MLSSQADQNESQREGDLEPTDLEDAVDEPQRVIPAIEFRDVHLSFDDSIILNGISFTVRRGETKVILGRSGGGKSTIIRLILGLLKPDSGSILVDGEDITDYLTPRGMRLLEVLDDVARRNNAKPAEVALA